MYVTAQSFLKRKEKKPERYAVRVEMVIVGHAKPEITAEGSRMVGVETENQRDQGLQLMRL
jgi:hypothetical protein